MPQHLMQGRPRLTREGIPTATSARFVMSTNSTSANSSLENSTSQDSNASLILRKPQLAKMLGVSIRHLDNLTRRGLLPRVRLGRSIRYRRDAVMAALKKLEGGAT